MKQFSLATVAVLAFLAAFVGPDPVARAASVLARIDISEQRMTVFVDGRRAARWPVSTARRGYRTPVGTFRPGRMYKRYFSKKYHGSPMPYSVFFHGGYAIHGTNAIRSLGRPASHGCIRLHPDNARQLFTMIERHGKRNARIVITR
ncbi:MAG: hypothetical protein CMN87_15325 [Stappia sp.]|uniref:L,D-transpeptidase n=1 Tax=Stappia sp. TaxID=1870903 RepID=UPI000C4E6B4B|nr:L,D-transpeptidase [Stappia sp.]MAA98538.1 hypothetical protein [Stappia sp.]MBM21378.1 hypothetical protein [Stappia sp.]